MKTNKLVERLCLFGLVWQIITTLFLIITMLIMYPPGFGKSGEWGLGYILIFWWGLSIPVAFIGLVGARKATKNLPLSIVLQLVVAASLAYIILGIPPLRGLFWVWLLQIVSIIVFILSGLITLIKGVMDLA